MIQPSESTHKKQGPSLPVGVKDIILSLMKPKEPLRPLTQEDTWLPAEPDQLALPRIMSGMLG